MLDRDFAPATSTAADPRQDSAPECLADPVHHIGDTLADLLLQIRAGLAELVLQIRAALAELVLQIRPALTDLVLQIRPGLAQLVTDVAAGLTQLATQLPEIVPELRDHILLRIGRGHARRRGGNAHRHRKPTGAHNRGRGNSLQHPLTSIHDRPPSSKRLCWLTKISTGVADGAIVTTVLQQTIVLTLP
jgi:hypothetical protein